MAYMARGIWFLDPATPTPIMKDIKAFIDEYWLKLHSEEKTLNLFHYTNINGLKGILDSRSFWFTDTGFLNDPSELEYGQKLIIEKLKSHKEGKDTTFDELLDMLITDVEAFNVYNYRAYITCFCQADNLLSQWRSYSNYGGGYNIGFEFKTDTIFSHKENLEEQAHIILRKVIYDQTEQNKIIDKYLQYIKNGLNILLKTDWAKQFPDEKFGLLQVAQEATNVLFDFLLCMKNKVFEEENEWRLIKVIDPDRLGELLKYKTSDTTLIPYIETFVFDNVGDDKIMPISDIKFGPSLDKKNTELVLKQYIKSMTLEDNKIKIPVDLKIEGAGYDLRP